MRRSLDFGTLTGSLSTLKSSRSNGKDSSSAGTSTSNGLTSPSPNGSRYGTIAGVPSYDESALARPRSAIGSSTTGGATGGLHSGRARGHFGLAGLFSVGQGGSSGSGTPREVQQGEDDNTQGGTLYPSQSITDVNHASSQAPSPSFRATAATAPSTPDTPAERERALMLAVESAKAKDQAWEIIVTQSTEKESMFLEYAGDDRSNAPGKRNGLIKRSSSNSANVIFGKARRFLGRAGDRITAQNATASPAPPSSVPSGRNEVQADASAPALADVLSVTSTTPGKHRPIMNASSTKDPPQPTSPAKRRLESSEDDEALQMGLNVTSPTIVTSTPAAGKGASAQFANGDPSQLLVLYVTTGTSSLTLYRRLGQLVKLDDEVRMCPALMSSVVRTTCSRSS